VICNHCRREVREIYADPLKRDKLVAIDHTLMPADGGSTQKPTPCPGSLREGVAPSLQKKVAV